MSEKLPSRWQQVQDDISATVRNLEVLKVLHGFPEYEEAIEKLKEAKALIARCY